MRKSGKQLLYIKKWYTSGITIDANPGNKGHLKERLIEELFII
jgi:hypothetical protein